MNIKRSLFIHSLSIQYKCTCNKEATAPQNHIHVGLHMHLAERTLVEPPLTTISEEQPLAIKWPRTQVQIETT